MTRSVWSAVTCHRFYGLADWSAKQSRVQRLGETRGLSPEFDGDKSPAESADQSAHSKVAKVCRSPGRWRASTEKAFTLTELLVVLAILALLAATQLTAMTGAKAPSRLAQCVNNVRQIGAATLLYSPDNRDTYPHGQRVTGLSTFAVETGWPRLLLRYMGGYTTNVQPAVFVCPNETQVVAAPMQLHYQGNREIIRDINNSAVGLLAARIRRPSIYWMFTEKNHESFGNVSSGALEQVVIGTWNISPGLPGYRRHDGGLTATAADGHVEWLRMPPYEPGAPPPPNLVELGDCAEGSNPAPYGLWITNGPRSKLFYRARPGGIF